jgi:hypothetical protein
VIQQKRFSGVSLLAFFAFALLGLGVAKLTSSQIPLLAGVFLGIYFLLAIKVVDQWEKVAVLRFGRYRGLRGPGVFLIIVPILETLSRYVCHKWVGQPHDTRGDVQDHVISRHLGGHISDGDMHSTTDIPS